MKFKFQSLAYILFVGLIGFTSCKKDDENVPAPTLTFKLGTATAGSFNAGETASFTMDLASDNDYTSLKATLTYTDAGGSSKSLTVKDANNSNKEINYTKNSDIEDAYDGTSVVKVALPADAKRGTEWTISVAAATSGGTTTATFKGMIIQSWTAVLLGARSNAAPSFFAPSTGEKIASSDAVSKVGIIDITYAWDETQSPNAPVLASYFARTALGFLNVPAAARKTQFIATTITPAQFLDETASWSDLISGLSIGANEKVNITPSTVYAFKNADGKVGLVHVDAVTAGADGETTIRVKF